MNPPADSETTPLPATRKPRPYRSSAQRHNARLDSIYAKYLALKAAKEKAALSPMKTDESTPPPISGVAAFLGETAAPEATTTVTFTGTQRSVAKAIAGMAKKPAKKTPATPSVPSPEEEVIVPEDSELDVELAPEGSGEDDLPPLRGPRDESKALKAADIVESLIQEVPASEAK